ncbi:hypothetical protein AUEXF2481DRAFT_44698 [Aureobasidium subglaciale EXF-2481]|uniref:Stress-response A/B barrel domain-containing protein n=1 Tax=Aureobasidium subglaciale (strain EXF-2481) TaxID=1043005 RepID=A0A074Y4C0_AURSE|nr:uncharacterized protein AUEXF2481DRAFT_44698 [Aureobasidium subglaciale EXF-2481]KAI5198084.1 hypothetical protein E4T38_07706 [Aureobasidium subglaciale]KAI5216922.1 hypothetical protein E4T40_07716 [Aureobasidium subglaciale]KAI5220193.1 hypothetical protein E4T41_07631 [Aureobasidium subglaciale]KAI5258197.1 hypothetical protein E4T46_07607 [Aureobasidium subglaciale]KEQ90804.1 hypothetical protein AUEXF2481DRAFT_44698 [Aureobasidium subglaciale EXF-2481]
MPVYHIVLFKLKPDVSQDNVVELEETAASLHGKIPGLIKIDVEAPHPPTAHRGQGYYMGLVARLDGPDRIASYAEHMEHQK